MDTRQLESRLTAALSLDIRPVAVTFVPAAPDGIPVTKEVVPSSCAFWRHAERGTFYAPAAAHFNCPIGAMVMGFDLPTPVNDELGQLMTKMCDCDYLDPAEAAKVPTRSGSPAGIVYGPLGEHPLAPAVVLLWLTPRQAMLCNEAAGTAKWSQTALQATGRPACAALPLAVAGDTPVMSFGCAGMRTYTGIDDRLLFAIPGGHLAKFVDAVASSIEVNQAMNAFYEERRAALTQTADG